MGPGLTLIGAALASAGVRVAEARLRRGGSAYLGLVLGAGGLTALAAAAGLILLQTPQPDAHAYDATLWVIAGYVLFHACLTAGMMVFLTARAAGGYLSPRRFGEIRITRLWTDYTAVTSLLGLGAIYLPGVLT